MLLSVTSIITSAQLVFAQTSDNNKEKISTIQTCEKIYPDLQKLGNTKFRERYQYFVSFRDCMTLYNDPSWDSTELDRTDKLILLLEKSTQIKVIRDRFNYTQNIPQWIKDDARRWDQGEEKDNIFSYGIRYMMNSKIIKSENILDYRNCSYGTICLSKNDFVKYSIKNNNNDAIIRIHTFDDTSDNILVSSKESSKNNKTNTNFQINKTSGLVESDKKCCILYPYVQPIPMNLGTKTNQEHPSEIVSEVIFSFKNLKRPSFVAKDKAGKYLEIIDKETGIVLFSKYQDKTRHLVQIAQLVDTNIVKKDTTIRYDDMKIPFWFKNTVKWWTQGKVSDSEYIAGISYLLKNDVLRI